MNKEKIMRAIRLVAQFLLNPRFLLCFGLAWILTNGWSYILLIIGTHFQIGWMITVATAYITFLWLPVSPEKIVTLAISIGLLRFLFPQDQKTLGLLRKLHARAKAQCIRKRQAKE